MASSSKVEVPLASSLSDLPARWLNSEDASRYLRVSVQTVRAMLRRGDLKAARLGSGGGPVLIDRLDIDRFLERKKRTLPPYRTGSHPWVKKSKPWLKRRDRQKSAR